MVELTVRYLIAAFDGRMDNGNATHACKEDGGLLCGTRVDEVWWDMFKTVPESDISCKRCLGILRAKRGNKKDEVALSTKESYDVQRGFWGTGFR